MKTSINIKPLGDRVLVEPLSDEEREKTTKLGIVIPDTVEKEKSERGRVIAVGPGKITDEGKLIPLSVKKGQIVIFSKYGPDEIKVGNKEYYIIKEDNILAVLE
ncbi:MAG: co-chaperone GroES [Candidatus Tagabacteria bacterium]